MSTSVPAVVNLGDREMADGLAYYVVLSRVTDILLLGHNGISSERLSTFVGARPSVQV